MFPNSQVCRQASLLGSLPYSAPDALAVERLIMAVSTTIGCSGVSEMRFKVWIPDQILLARVTKTYILIRYKLFSCRICKFTPSI